MVQTITEPVEIKEPVPLVFEWTWGEGEHRTDYQIEVDTDELFRTRIISGSPEEKRVLMAQFMDADLIDWKVSIDDSDDQSVKIIIAASVGGCKKAGKPHIVDKIPGV